MNLPDLLTGFPHHRSPRAARTRFQPGALGRRRALVVGTRLYVYQVISTRRGNDGDIDQTAADFGIAPQLIRAALAYYADYVDEINDDAAIAEQLRILGHDAVAAVEPGWHREPDEALLLLCVAEQRALLTNNVGNFMIIVRSWAVRGQQHPGLVFTSDTSLPRTHSTIGRYVELLDALLHEHPKPDDFLDRIHRL